jgi:spore coat protein U-like protein
MTVHTSWRFAAAALLGFCVLPAQAAITCTLGTTSVNLNYVNGQTTNANASGSITLNCTRTATDPNSQTYWVGIDRGSAGALRVYRHGGNTTTNANRLTVILYKNGTTTSWTATGGGRVNGTLNFGAALNASTTLTYNFRVPSGQNGRTAGIFDEIFTTSLQLTTTGPVVETDVFTATVSILNQCFVGQVATGNTAPGAVSPTTLNLSYVSFSSTPQSATMNFSVDCTRGTPYTVALAPTTGTLLGLNYTLGLSSSAATGDGLAQPYTVTGTIAAGQAGTCATGTCAASAAHTVTVTY